MTALLLLFSLFFSAPAGTIQGNFSMSGFIRDMSGKAVDGIRVLLLDDNQQQIRTVFSSSGRYQFKGLRTGFYYVKIEVTGTPYEEVISPRIDLQTFSPLGGKEDYQYDFALRFKRGANPAAGNVFTQNVPEPARLEYERGTKSLTENSSEAAIAAFNKSIELFPDYFLALEAVGSEYVKTGEYAKAVPVLTHALEVNRTASKCMYALGVAHLKLKQLDESVQWLEKSATLDPQSINVHMMLGIAYGSKRQLDKAEASLKKACQVGGAQAAEAHLYLAGLYNGQKRYPDAVQELELYLKEAKDIPDREKIKTMLENLKAKGK
jgi:tetratricopeptide (TPR) repeat protein